MEKVALVMPYMMARIVGSRNGVDFTEATSINPRSRYDANYLNIKVTDTLCDWNNGVFAPYLGESTLPNVKRRSAESVDESTEAARKT